MVETELHRAILREDWALSMSLALAHPELATEIDPARGFLPLHLAAVCGAPLTIVRRLAEAHPEGLTAKDNWGRTPLDAAVRNEKAGAATLDYLRADPTPFLALAETRDWKELVGLQRRQPAGAWVAALAEERGAPGDIVAELCEGLGPESLPELVEARLWEPLVARSGLLVTAESCAVRDANGHYPVEIAIQGGAPKMLVQQLTSHSPQPILVHAISTGDWDRAETLVSLKPDWAAVKDHRRGWLPVHVAVTSGAPLSLIRLLAEAHPAGLATKDSNDRTAYEIAVRQAQTKRESQASSQPLSPTRGPSAGALPSSNHRNSLVLQQRQAEQTEVINFLQHYPALCKAAERQDWEPLLALQRDMSNGSAWVAGVAATHGAPSSVMDGLSKQLGLHEMIAAEAWTTLLRHSDQHITPASCTTPKMAAVGINDAAANGQMLEGYPLQQALQSRSAPSEVLRLLRSASDGCDLALRASLNTAMATHQWAEIASLQLLTPDAGAAMAKEVMELKQSLAVERSARQAAEAQKEAALSRETAVLARERSLQAQVVELRRQLDARD